MFTEAIKPVYRHVVLEEEIRKLTPLSRSEFSSVALSVAVSIDDNTWLKLFEEVSKLPKSGESPVPNSMQLRLDDQAENYFKLLYSKANLVLCEHNKLKSLRKHFFVLLIWQNYYDYLQKNRMDVGVRSSAEYQMTASDMFKTLAEIVLLNREQDGDTIEQIKHILQEWKEKNN